MNTKEKNSIRVLLQSWRHGEEWGSWRGNVRLIDETTVETTFGRYKVAVDGETCYLLDDSEQRKFSFPVVHFGRLLSKNQEKWNESI
jgi:hypothetical protein